MPYKPLTKEQQEKFKEMWNQGYTYMEIFSELGQPYEYVHMAVSRGMNYRKKLNLSKRPANWKYSFYSDFWKQRSIERQKERKQKLEQMIFRWDKKINEWKQELATL